MGFSLYENKAIQGSGLGVLGICFLSAKVVAGLFYRAEKEISAQCTGIVMHLWVSGMAGPGCIYEAMVGGCSRRRAEVP